MDKKKLAQELNVTIDDINFLLLESGLDENPESFGTISEEDATKLREIANSTRKTMPPTPKERSTALAEIPVAEIALQTGIQMQNIYGMIDAIWEIEQTRIKLEAHKLEQLRHSAQLEARGQIVESELTHQIARLQKVIAYDPITSDPAKKQQELRKKTADILATCRSINDQMGKTA